MSFGLGPGGGASVPMSPGGSGSPMISSLGLGGAEQEWADIQAR